jgi:hypothetical protein
MSGAELSIHGGGSVIGGGVDVERASEDGGSRTGDDGCAIVGDGKLEAGCGGEIEVAGGGECDVSLAVTPPEMVTVPAVAARRR